jgi:monovalent cation:H+ antiporter, CPA1 family
MFFISSGAVEVILPKERVHLGSGEFFGEMALLSGARRTADVVALSYCQLLVLSTADFRRFLELTPNAEQQINRVMQERTLMNDRAAQESSVD